MKAIWEKWRRNLSLFYEARLAFDKSFCRPILTGSLQWNFSAALRLKNQIAIVKAAGKAKDGGV
jgi:hypothetical protein